MMFLCVYRLRFLVCVYDLKLEEEFDIGIVSCKFLIREYCGIEFGIGG